MDKRDKINTLKGIAIISTVLAHSSSVSMNSSGFNLFFQLILESLGTVGVPLFFVLSGYLFHPDKISCKMYFKNKVLKIGIPWIISGTIIYLYVFVRKREVSALSFLNFISGAESYLYYLTVLFALWLLFYIPAFRKKRALRIFEILGVLSICFLFKYVDINVYLNPLNWIFYFATGLDYQINYSSYKSDRIIYMIICPLVFALIITIKALLRIRGSYWTTINFAMILFFLLTMKLYVVDANYSYKKMKWLRWCGVETLGIYLWHMPFVGVVSFLIPSEYALLILCRLVIACIIIMGFIKAIQMVSDYIGFKWIKNVMGII